MNKKKKPAKIGLNSNIHDIFKDYEEWYKDNQIRFKGFIKADNISQLEPYKLIEIISGGRKYISYKINVENGKVNGTITYPTIRYSLGEQFEPEEIEMIDGCYDNYNYDKRPGKRKKFDELTIETIRKAYKSGQTQVSLAEDYKTTTKTIYEIINHKGAYK